MELRMAGLTPSVPASAQDLLSSTKGTDPVRDLALVVDRTLLRTRTTVVAGFIAGLLLSPKLWVSTRLYPLVDVVHGLPHLPVCHRICGEAAHFHLCVC